MSKIVLQQERDFGSKINATFVFIKQEFKPLLTCLAYMVLPLALLAGVAYGLFNANLYKSIAENSLVNQSTLPFEQLMAMFSGFGLLYIFVSVLSGLLLFSTVLSYMKLYKQGRENITPADVWSVTKGHIGMLFILAVVNYILIIAGTCLLLLPGIYVSIVLSMSFCIMVFEDADISHSIRESFSITKGKWWSTFGLIMILGLISGIISVFFSLPNTIYTTSLINDPGQIDAFTTSVLGVLYLLGIYLVYVILIVGIAFQYFNLNERKYATGLIDDIESIGQNAEE